MTMFKKELKNNVKTELMCYNEIINNLNNFIKVVIKFDNELYELTINISHNEEKHNKTEIYYEKLKDNHNSKQCLNSKSALFNNYEAMSMKFNFMQYKRKNLKKKQKRKNDKACYSCNKSNHFVKNCKLKNMMQ